MRRRLGSPIACVLPVVPFVWNFAPAPVAFPASDLCELIGTTDVFVVNEHAAFASGCFYPRICHRRFRRKLALDLSEGPAAASVSSRRGHAVRLRFIRTDFAKSQRRILSSLLSTRQALTTPSWDLRPPVFDEKLHSRLLSREPAMVASLACLVHGAQGGMPIRDSLKPFRTIH